MGSGTAKSVRLDLGIDLRKRVHEQKGTDGDILFVQLEAPDFMNDIARQLVECADTLRSGRNFFRIMHDDVVIQIPALKRPTLKRVQESWSNIEKIERDNSTEEAVTLRLATVLKCARSSIDAEIYERRLLPLRNQGRLLGFQHRQYLLKVQRKYPTLMMLLGEIYIDFPGIIVVQRDGHRGVPCVNFGGSLFMDDWHWFTNLFGDCHTFDEAGRVAVSST